MINIRYVPNPDKEAFIWLSLFLKVITLFLVVSNTIISANGNPKPGFSGYAFDSEKYADTGNGMIATNKSLDALQQQRNVSGRITDANGDPLIGVTVRIKGTTQGAFSDVNGDYSLPNVPPNAVLVFSFIGMETREIVSANLSTINITLANAFIGMQEVVVVGYGTIQKRDLTGAVSSVGGKDLLAIGSSSPVAAMQGQVAGVNIAARTGQVGSDYNIQIRGVNSLGGRSPLFVVDGIMVDNINFLNPAEIERIDILKDASSTAIYGSRGSNGVILVTTKSGSLKQGAPAFSYSGYTGVRTFSNLPKFMDYDKAVRLTKDRSITNLLLQGRPVPEDDLLIGYDGFQFRDYIERGLQTDWVDLITKPSLETNHYLSASGGSENVSYVLGAGYQGDDGNIEGQYFRKYSFKASVDTRASEKWSMNANLNFTFTDRELVSNRIEQRIFQMPPWAPAYDENDQIIQRPMSGISSYVNPLAYMENDILNTKSYYLISNIRIQYKPVDWMTVRSTISPYFRNRREGEYRDPFSTTLTSISRMSFDNNFAYVWDNQFSVNREIKSHRINFDYVYSVQLDKFESLFGYGEDTPFNSEFYNLASAKITRTGSNFSQQSMLSHISRLNYSFLDKYLVTTSIRWDGSSKLAEGYKWAYFPSAAIAWRVSEEPFIKALDYISNIKLRLSFGYTGNNNIPTYSTQFSANQQTFYNFGGTSANGYRPNSIANKQLTWERTKEWNLGLDFGFFNNRISGEVNIYDKVSLNLLMQRKLPVPTGWATMRDNIGSLSNRGIEIQLRTINIETRNFSWETNITFSKNTNRILELYGKKEDDVPNRWFIGHPVDVVYALVFDGVWQKEELAPEDMQKEGFGKVKDLNNDGVIDIDNDMAILGSPIPDWIGSFYTRLRYKNWDFMATLYTKQGVLIYSPFHKEYLDINTKYILDVPYYMRDNPITGGRRSNTYPQLANAGPYYGEDTDRYGYPSFNKDASFVRLQNVSFGYTFNSSWLKGIGINSMRIYLNAVNPIVWTKYEGYDPEWAGIRMFGTDANSPSFSVYQFGANISF